MDNNIGTKLNNKQKLYTEKKKVDEQSQPSSFIAHTAFTIVKTYVESNGTKDYYLQDTTNSHMYRSQSAYSLLSVVLCQFHTLLAFIT